MKYKNLEQLAAAYESGELNRDRSPLIIDSDETPVFDRDNDEEVFNGGTPKNLLKQALDLLGIPYRQA